MLAVVPPSPVMRRSSDPQLSPSAGTNPPEHPAHTSHSAHSSPAHHPSYQSHSSETAGSYCDLRPCPTGPPKPPAKGYVERLRVEEGRQDGAREDGEGMFSAPQVETASSFRPSRYKTQDQASRLGLCDLNYFIEGSHNTESFLRGCLPF